MSRRHVGVHRTVAAAASAGGFVLRTLAEHCRFELTACCAACDRYVVLDLAALAARFGWNVPLDALRRRLACRRCGRTGSVLIGRGDRKGKERNRWAVAGRCRDE